MNYVKEVKEHFGKLNVFTVRDLNIFLARKRLSRGYSHLLIHNLLKKNELHRLGKGVYTFKNNLELAGFAFSPFYYGLQDALSIHNVGSQETNPVIITPRKVRPGLRNIMGSNVLVRRINRRMFFGFEMLNYGNCWVPVSNIEKTLIDFIYFKEPISKEILVEIKGKIRKEVLVDYSKKVPDYVRRRIKAILR